MISAGYYMPWTPTLLAAYQRRATPLYATTYKMYAWNIYFSVEFISTVSGVLWIHIFYDFVEGSAEFITLQICV